MLELRTLGRLELLNPSGSSRGGRRMILALLVWLARSGSRPVSRDQLADLFWEASDLPAARHSLRQGLTELRALLPDGALAVDARQVALDPTGIALDLDRFERHIIDREWRAALVLHAGVFLPGMEEIGGEAWRHWLNAERAGVQRQVVAALDAAIAEATAEAAWPEAMALAERWCQADPDDERAVVALIRAMLSAGQREAAAGRHAAFLKHLQMEGIEPSAEFITLGRALGATANPAGRRARGFLTPDLVGRRVPFSRLSECWDAVRVGAGRLAVLEGDDGLGKSRLLEEFVRWVRNRAEPSWIAEIRAYAGEDGADLRALGGLLDRFGSAPGLPAADRADLSALAALAPALRQRFPALEDPPAPIALALPRVVSEIATEVPVLIVLDDADRADPASLDALAALARHLPPRTMLLLSCRPGQLTDSALRDLLGDAASPALRLGLRPLDQAATVELIASMAPISPPAAAAIATAVVEDLGGAPAHARALVTQLAESGQLRPDPRGSWELAGPLARPVRLPEELREQLALAIRDLGPEAREILELVAAFGGPADPGILERAARRPTDRFQEALGDLLTRRLIRRSPGRANGYEFPNEAARRVVWESLAGTRQAEFTRRVAAPDPSAARRTRLRRGAAAALLLGGIAALIVGVRSADLVPEGGTLLLADVQAAPEDSAVARSLFLAATMELNEAERVRPVPRSLVRDALGRMGRPGGDSLLDEVLAREVAVREGIELVVALEMTRQDEKHLVSFRLVDPASGDVLSAGSVVVSAGDAVLAGTNQLLRQIRRALGEAAEQVGDREGYPRVSTHSLDALVQYTEGRRAWTRREYLLSRQTWQRAVAIDSGFALAWAGLAEEAYRVNNMAQGADLLRRALAHADRLTPREQAALHAIKARRIGTTAEAIAVSRQMAERYPDRDTWYDLGTALMRAQRCEEAVPAFQRSLDADPRFSNALINLATCHQFLQQFDSAVIAYQQAEQLDSMVLRVGNVGAEYATALLMIGQTEAATAQLRVMQGWGPNWNRARAQRQLAWIAMAEGRFGEAALLAARAAAIHAASASPLSAFRDRMIGASALLGAGDRTGAARELRSAWRERPDSLLEPGLLWPVVALARRAGMPAEAAAARRRALALVRAGVVSHEPIRAALLAAEALDRDRPAEALRATDLEWPRPAGERWGYLDVVRAEALAGSGAVDSALALWQRIAASPWLGWELQDYWMRADLEVARLASQAGRPAEALVAVNRFLTRWKDADPDAPELREALLIRERLAREGGG